MEEFFAWWWKRPPGLTVEKMLESKRACDADPEMMNFRKARQAP
jgi:hypothetical protein